ncbi:hypothetical protein Cni_G10627 [Canna indica]|uniref:Fe2OG dioxygenase domain-containing protein n=1 Tax=Canna indica TaxID=4628 RepID=A0AAQ3K4J1_9LILI|nr:hypothetical protein Cni_G10627 [Canna indica]
MHPRLLNFNPSPQLMESSKQEAAADEQEEQAAADFSYPPLFLQSNTNTNPTVPDPSPPESNTIGFDGGAAIDVPVFDLQSLDLTALGEACRDWGLFRLINHGIPPLVSVAIQGQAREILALPFDEKAARLTRPGFFYFWGTPALTLKLKEINWLEGIHVPLGRLRSVGSAADFDGFEDFGSLVDEYGQHMARIARTLFNAMAIILKLDSDMFSSYLCEHDGTFRIYRYPKCATKSDYFAMEPHTDSSVLSIVNQDDVGGLQILQNGSWFDVKPVAGSLIINLGDIMQAISDDEYKSVEHRVIVNRERERLSLCYFAFPAEDCLISSSRYMKFTYKEFKNQVAEDIKASGGKLGLKRFKINVQDEPSESDN